MPRRRELSDEEVGAIRTVARVAVETYCHDLTALAREGRFSPLSEYGAEVDRVFEVLARKHKNNPMLIAPPGPERIPVVLEVARRIAAGEAPAELRVRQVLALDLEALFSRELSAGYDAGVAAAAYRWYLPDDDQFPARQRAVEQRLVLLFEAVRASAGEAILFVDNFHRLLGAPPEPSADTANLLKSFFGYRIGQILATSALREYRQHIEPDATIQCRFQEILLREPAGV